MTTAWVGFHPGGAMFLIPDAWRPRWQAGGGIVLKHASPEESEHAQAGPVLYAQVLESLRVAESKSDLPSASGQRLEVITDSAPAKPPRRRRRRKV